MKKIMFVCNRLGGGGAERVITILANELKKNYKCEFVTFVDCDKKYEVDKNISIKTLFAGEKNFSQFDKIKILRKTIKLSKPDYIISFEHFINIKVLFASLGLKSKVIVSERNDPKTVGGKFPMNIIRNIAYRFCHKLVCQTPDAKAYFPKNIQKKSVIIPNPIKSDLPEPWIGERNTEIVNFCRLEKQKNLELLVDAFKLVNQKHPKYSLHIFGDGKEKVNIQNYINSSNLENKAFLHNSIPNIHERILKSAMFVSSSNYEGLSNSMLEAMALGIPTICTDCPCGGARMVINNGENGLLTPVNQLEPLVKAMKNVIEDENLTKNITTNSIKIKNDLSANRILDKWINIL